MAPVGWFVDKEDSQQVPLKRMLALAIPELPILAVATVALAVSSGLGLVYPQAVSWLVDNLAEGGTASDFNQAAAILVVLFLVQSVFSMLRSWLYTVAGERVVARLREHLFSAIIGQEIGFFDQRRTGELTNRLASDTTVLQNTVTVNVSMALRFTVTGLGGLGLLIYMSPRLAVVSMAVVPVVAIGATVYGRLLRRISTKVQDALAQSTEIAEETISGVRTVRAFAQEQQETARYNVAVQKSYRLAARRALYAGFFQGGLSFAGYSAIALVVWWGGGMVADKAMTLGDLTAFLLYTVMVAFSLGALSGLWGDFMKAAGASQRVFELLDRHSPLEHSDGAVLENISGEIRFESVDFCYPTRPDVPVLTEFDLAVSPGQVVALVGPSGSGKSTVAQLLARFYDPKGGVVTVDGHPLTDLDAKALRRHIGTVAQEPTLFATSITNNIRYGRPDASMEDVIAAATAANAHDFVSEFPEGYETQVGERGVRLSGGQKQRVAIARALLKDPKILILDEATSALDSESEHLVQEALDRLMQGRTTLVIAHRLSTVREADQVFVLDRGRVVEHGDHSSLIAAGGLYERLVKRQQLAS
jgi:ABC transporter fused permease/ATP-binding protein